MIDASGSTKFDLEHAHAKKWAVGVGEFMRSEWVRPLLANICM